MAVAVAVALAVPRFASATDCSGIHSPCINDDTLWPHAGVARFSAAGSAETIATGQIGFGLAATYLSRPILLGTRTAGEPTDQYVVNDQVNASFLWSYGVSDRLEIDLALPVTLGQGGTGLEPITGGAGLKDTAVRDMRFGFAYALVAHDRTRPLAGPGLVGRFEMSAPTGDREQFAGERSGVFVPSVAGDYRLGRLFAGAEIGARLRSTTEFQGARVGTQGVAALGVGYDVFAHDLLAAMIEARVFPTFAEQHRLQDALTSVPDGEHIAPAEWHLSARTAPLSGGDLSIEAGGGGGIPLGSTPSITTPRLRFTLSVRWAPLGRSEKR